MAVIKSGASTDQLTIDPTSKAGRISVYDSLGTYSGPKATYRAAVTSTFNAAAGAAVFFVIQGSSTKTVRVQRIRISGLALTAVAYVNVVAEKYSTAPSGGTPAALVLVPLDSNSAASTVSLCNVYTAAPTEGTLVGTITSVRVLMQAATPAAGGVPDIIDLEFRNLGGETTGVVLRGTAQGLGLAFGTAPATAVTLSLEIEWTEE